MTAFARLAAVALLAVACSPEAERAAAPSRIASAPPPGPGAVEILAAYVPAPPSDVAALYLVAHDASGEGDRLLAAHCDAAARTELHRTVQEDGRARMRPAQDGFPLPPGGRAVLAPGGSHVMLIGLDRRLAVGDEIEVELEFERAGRVPLRAAVVAYADVEAHADAAAAGPRP